MTIQTTGYQRDRFFPDIALGVIGGLDNAIWSYVFATIILSGSLSVFLPVGLTIILVSWAIAGFVIVALSKVDLHLVCVDEQVVIILGAIGATMVVYMGEDATTAKGLSTLLAVIALTSLLTAFAFFVIARLQLSRMLNMVPYPVVCGYMVGFVWLYLDAGVTLTTGESISFSMLDALHQGDNGLQLAISVVVGLLLYVCSEWIKSPLVLPILALFFVGAFYGFVEWNGVPHSDLVAKGWLYDIDTEVGNVGGLLSIVSPAAVDIGFIITVLPEIATMIFITMLTASIDVSILSALNYKLSVRSANEIMNNGVGILACSLLCAPPTVTDASESEIYKNFGASSRWKQLSTSIVLLAVAPIGVASIAFVPTVLMGAVVILIVLQIFHYWMYKSLRELSNEDRAIILLIFGTVVAFGFVEGVLLGIFVTALLFVLRYSLTPSIRGQFELGEHRSSVERSATDNAVLNNHSEEVLIVTLRGYLFFGSSNSIRDALFDKIQTGRQFSILFDLRWVSGVDGSAMQVFRQIKQLCDSNDIQLLFSSAPESVRNRLCALEAVSLNNGEPLIFNDLDFAIEWLEDEILARHTDYKDPTILGFLEAALGDHSKALLLLGLMQEVKVNQGEALFRQGDPDNGLYILESGAMTAEINDGVGGTIRIKKFSPGALIGELSRYTDEKTRTASIVADKRSVLYHLDMSCNKAKAEEMRDVISAVHEMVACALSRRLVYMNRRLAKELS